MIEPKIIELVQLFLIEPDTCKKYTSYRVVQTAGSISTTVISTKGAAEVEEYGNKRRAYICE